MGSATTGSAHAHSQAVGGKYPTADARISGKRGRVCECTELWACGLRRKEGTIKLLRVEPQNDVSRCHTAEI